MTQSTVGKGFRWLIGLLAAGLAGCEDTLETGVYEFSPGSVERLTCPEAPPPSGSWEGTVEIFGNEVQVSFFDPRLFTTAGERALVGRFFFERGASEHRDFIADSSFRTVIPIGGALCPSFSQLGIRATTDGDGAFTGFIRATHAFERTAPRECLASCAWELVFRAERIGDIVNTSSGSSP